MRAPIFAPKVIVDRFIKSKELWISKRIKLTQNMFKRQYKEGEEFFYFGKELKLRHIKTNLKNPLIQVENENLVVLSDAFSRVSIKKTLLDFYRREAERVILKILKKHESKFEHYGKVTVKDYRSKWGSCTSKNNLSFNAKLAMAPKDVIEYVVLHELSHIQIKNHSKVFWNAVAVIDEKYIEKRKWLNKHHPKLVL